MASRITRKDYLKGTVGGVLSLALLSKIGVPTQAAPVTDNLRSDGSSAGGGSTVEWNQLQNSGNKIAEVTIDGAMTEVFSPNGSFSLNYSTDEQMVGTWIDGKPIYQISFHNNGLPISFPIDVSALNIGVLVHMDAAFSDSEQYGGTRTTMSCTSGIDGRSLFLRSDKIETTGWYSRHYVTIRYTKMTD